MTKKIISLLIALLLLLSVALPAFADENEAVESRPHIVDSYNLLTEDEREKLEEQAEDVINEHNFDIVIVTVYSLDGKTAEAYADDYFDYNGYGRNSSRDGILFLVSMEERDFAFSTSGLGISVFTDAGMYAILDVIKSDLSGGNYYDCFSAFISQCDEYLKYYEKNDKAYDKGNLPRTKKQTAKGIIISLFIAAIISLIIIFSVKSAYKPVRFNRSAANYLVNGSLQLTGSYDNFLYTNVSRVKIETESSSSGGSSTHTSSSGSSHGGISGKF